VGMLHDINTCKHFAHRPPSHQQAFNNRDQDSLCHRSAKQRVCRINLEEGRFLESLPSNSSGINKLGVSPAHGLVGAAGEEGLLECYDLRQERCAGRFDAASAAGAVTSSFCSLLRSVRRTGWWDEQPCILICGRCICSCLCRRERTETGLYIVRAHIEEGGGGGAAVKARDGPSTWPLSFPAML